MFSEWARNIKNQVSIRSRETTPVKGPITDTLYGYNFSSLLSGRTGIVVTAETSLNLSAIYSAVTLLCSTCCNHPLEKHRLIDDKGNREREYDLITYLLNHRPNPEINALDFMEFGVGNLLLRGNFYAEIEYNLVDEPIAFWPIPSSYITPLRMEDGSIWYAYHSPTGVRKLLPSKKILHVKDYSLDGVVGLSRITLARLGIELGLAQEGLALSLMTNEAKTTGVIEVPQELAPDQVESFKLEWNKTKGMLEKGRTVVLENGMTYKPISLSPKDTEFILSRQFQIQEIARWFRVPPHMLYELTRSTYSNITQQSLEFATYSVLPILNRFTSQYLYRFYTPQTIEEVVRQKSYKLDIELSYNLSQLLTADPVTQMTVLEKGIDKGIYAVNDALRILKQDTIGKEGDVRTINSSRIALKNVDRPVKNGNGNTSSTDGSETSGTGQTGK